MTAAPRTPRIAGGMLMLAGAFLLLSSTFPAWAHGTYFILGYAMAHAVIDVNAWAGYLWPALPWAAVAGGPMVLAGGAALFGRRWPIAQLSGLLSAAIAVGLLGGLLVAPEWPPVRLIAVPWRMVPGPLVVCGAAAGLIGLGAAFVGLLHARPARAALVLGPGATAVALVAVLGLVVYVTPLVTPPAQGGVPPLSLDPIPDWRTHPDEPYPFTGPVPIPRISTADGVFERDGGAWILRLERGRFVLERDDPPFRATGHYGISGERITFLNMPACPRVLGAYHWSISEGALRLELMDDSCEDGRRAEDLTAGPWRMTSGG